MFLRNVFAVQASLAGGIVRTGGIRAGLLAGGDAFSMQNIRHATKKAGGSTKNGRDSPGQRLGVKKFGGEVCISGNILVRQRGSKVKAGIDTKMGRDHTIFAVAPGWVRFSYDKLTKRSTIHVAPTPPANVPLPRGYEALPM